MEMIAIIHVEQGAGLDVKLLVQEDVHRLDALQAVPTAAQDFAQ